MFSGGNMKYYYFYNSFAEEHEINFSALSEYLVKTDKYGNAGVFVVDDNNFKDFVAKSNIKKFFYTGSEFVSIYGEDGCWYELRENEIIKSKNKATINVDDIWTKLEKHSKKLEKLKAKNANILNNSNGLISSGGFTLSSFKKYYYVNKEQKFVIPYRFRKSKMSKKPLIVYCGGAGTIGGDNFKPLFEFFWTASGTKAVKKDLNILIPQRFVPKSDIENESISIYVDNLAVLINELVSKCEIDSNKIYIFGISNGAMCTWKALLNHPELFAAAVEGMGWVFNYDTVDFNKISHIPIWLAHSSNDKVVSIISDDYCYEKLKMLGADVKYTRWDKHGHSMVGRFFKKEKWLEWLLSKSK